MVMRRLPLGTDLSGDAPQIFTRSVTLQMYCRERHPSGLLPFLLLETEIFLERRIPFSRR
jgi:hypothetical protein